MHVLRQRASNWIGRFRNLFHPVQRNVRDCNENDMHLWRCRKQLYVNSFMSLFHFNCLRWLRCYCCHISIVYFPCTRNKQKNEEKIPSAATEHVHLPWWIPSKRFKMLSMREMTQITIVIIFPLIFTWFSFFFFFVCLFVSISNENANLHNFQVSVSVCVNVKGYKSVSLRFHQVNVFNCIKWAFRLSHLHFLQSYNNSIEIEVTMFGSSAIFTSKSLDNTCDVTNTNESSFNSNSFSALCTEW